MDRYKILNTFLQKKSLPKELTSYDFLKSVAVILMVIDHVAAFFFPQMLWLRVLGRLCVPIWFFLIGYAKSRDLGPGIWIAVVLLTVSDIIMGWHIFTLSILSTIILVRLIIDPLMKLLKKSGIGFWIAAVFFLCLTPFTIPFFDYGTQGLLIAIFGYMLRRREELPVLRKYIHPYMIYTLACFAGTQWIIFHFSVPQAIVLFWGSAVVMLILLQFQPRIYPGLTNTLPAFLVNLIQLTGRRTLEIYVAHLLLIKFCAALIYPEWVKLFNWSWFP